MRTQAELESLTREVLGQDYVELTISKYSLTEDMDTSSAQIVCQLVQKGKGPLCSVEGTGVGMIDALFGGLQNALSNDYPSIGHIYFVGFEISGDFQSAKNGAHTDVPGNVTLTIENTSGRQFEFTTRSPSISASSVRVVLLGVEHFVNAELAVLRVYEWIEDAMRRNRIDLADKYTRMLSDLVQNASYSETIERRQSNVGV